MPNIKNYSLQQHDLNFLQWNAVDEGNKLNVNHVGIQFWDITVPDGNK